jgi:hypothetical protein
LEHLFLLRARVNAQIFNHSTTKDGHYGQSRQIASFRLDGAARRSSFGGLHDHSHASRLCGVQLDQLQHLVVGRELLQWWQKRRTEAHLLQFHPDELLHPDALQHLSAVPNLSATVSR